MFKLQSKLTTRHDKASLLRKSNKKQLLEKGSKKFNRGCLQALGVGYVGEYSISVVFTIKLNIVSVLT